MITQGNVAKMEFTTQDTLPLPMEAIAHVARKKVSLRWRRVLDLHFAGKTREEIMDITGYSYIRISQILNEPRMVELRQQVMKYYDQDFEALYPRVVQSIREGLVDPEPGVQTDARRDWLKAHGKFQPAVKEGGGNVNMSAEKIIFQILNQAKAERRELQG